MAMLFCVAAAATPVLGVHEAVAHVDAHHHHGDDVSGFGIQAAPHAHDEHEHSKLTEARVSMRSSHGEYSGTVVHVAAIISLYPYYAASRVPARPAPHPRCRDPLAITTILRI